MLTQYAAYGQNGLGFFSEAHNVEDSAREDIQCHILGSPLEPSEIKVKEVQPSPANPDGIQQQQGRVEQGELDYLVDLCGLHFSCTQFVHVIVSKYLVLQQSTSVYRL